MKTVLEVIKEHCRRTKLPVPSSAATNGDVQVVQLFALMNELLEDLLTRKAYQQITREASWLSTAAEDQGSIYTLADKGFISIIPDSFYNRSNNLRVFYNLTPEEWQSRKATAAATGPSYWARLRNDRLLLNPVPAANETFAFEYHSNYLVQDADSATTYKETFTKDGDKLLLPDAVPQSWLRWRWKAEKGLDYAEDFARYELVLDSLSKRQMGRTLDMAGQTSEFAAGVVIPVGSWSL